MLKDFGDFMERPIGQKITLTAAIFLGIGMVKSGMVEEGKLFVATAGGALLMSMRPGGVPKP